jgi:putative ABC transport system permease protein
MEGDFQFLLSYSFVIAVLLYSIKENLKLEKEVIIASIRALVQLLLLGFALHYIFSLQSLLSITLVLIGMTLFASYEAQRRVGSFWSAFISISSSSLTILFSLVLFGIIEVKVEQLIPIGGMLIGNSMNNYALAVERVKREVELSKETIEGYIALGATYREAVHQLKVWAIKTSLIPVINSLRTVGVVLIPGITTGMIIAGANPIDAVSFQLVVMYMILSVALITSIVGVSLQLKESY